MPLSTGDRLGAYEVIALLGHGAMGEVYRARDTRLGRDVAIKVLPAAFANDPDRLARLEREARLISQVNHPNVCTLFHICRRVSDSRARRRRDAAGTSDSGASAASRSLAVCRRYRGRTRGGAQQGHHPSRPETGQHQDHVRRHDQSARLWRREAGRRLRGWRRRLRTSRRLLVERKRVCSSVPSPIRVPNRRWATALTGEATSGRSVASCTRC